MAEIIREGKWEIPVLYEDNHLLVVVKPPNLPSQADSSLDRDLQSILKEYIGKKYQKPGNVYLGLVHRLDRPVGGVMVFARTSKAAARLSEAFSSHLQDRRYLAVLQGALSGERILEDWLWKDADGMTSVVNPDTPGARSARLRTRPLALRRGLTLAEICLFTGRKHQIRVQHAHLGLPLWGDARYGDGRPGQQIALWAYRLEFAHPTRREPLRFCFLPPMTGIWAEFQREIEELADV